MGRCSQNAYKEQSPPDNAVLESRKRIAKNNPEHHSRYEALIAVEHQISAMEQQGRSQDSKQEYERLVSERNKTKAWLIAENHEYQIAATRTTTTDIQKVLTKKTVLVDYFEYLKPKSYLDKLFSRRAKNGLVAFVLASSCFPNQNIVKFVWRAGFGVARKRRIVILLKTERIKEPFYPRRSGRCV